LSKESLIQLCGQAVQKADIVSPGRYYAVSRHEELYEIGKRAENKNFLKAEAGISPAPEHIRTAIYMNAL
jgi:hypothetical protein